MVGKAWKENGVNELRVTDKEEYIGWSKVPESIGAGSWDPLFNQAYWIYDKYKSYCNEMSL